MTSFHHQPEAQHPKSSTIHNNAGRLPHLLGVKQTSRGHAVMSAFDPKRTLVSLLMALSEYTGKLLSFSVSRAR